MELTKEQAIALYDSGFWKDLTPKQIVQVQLWTELLLVPFDLFHESMEKVLGRPIWTHEFACFEKLQQEVLGIIPAPTMDEIIDLIPKDKSVILIEHNVSAIPCL